MERFNVTVQFTTPETGETVRTRTYSVDLPEDAPLEDASDAARERVYIAWPDAEILTIDVE